MTVYAHDDLVDSVKPGDRVEIVGVFCASGIRVNPRVQTLRSVYKTFVDAIHIRKESSAAAGLQALSRSAVPGASSEAVLLEALRRRVGCSALPSALSLVGSTGPYGRDHWPELGLPAAIPPHPPLTAAR